MYPPFLSLTNTKVGPGFFFFFFPLSVLKPSEPQVRGNSLGKHCSPSGTEQTSVGWTTLLTTCAGVSPPFKPHLLSEKRIDPWISSPHVPTPFSISPSSSEKSVPLPPSCHLNHNRTVGSKGFPNMKLYYCVGFSKLYSELWRFQLLPSGKIFALDQRPLPLTPPPPHPTPPGETGQNSRLILLPALPDNAQVAFVLISTLGSFSASLEVVTGILGPMEFGTFTEASPDTLCNPYNHPRMLYHHP